MTEVISRDAAAMGSAAERSLHEWRSTQIDRQRGSLDCSGTLRHSKDRHYCGNAKTHHRVGAADGIRLRRRRELAPAIGPPPEVTAILPTVHRERDRRPDHLRGKPRLATAAVPLSASSARRYRSIEPLNSSPPPVARIGE